MLSAFIPAGRSYPAVQRALQLDHQGSVQPNPLVLRLTPLKLGAPTADRDRPGSRRSEPSSRTTLIGEQPNPWGRLQSQDVMGRHRGAKPRRRCELSGAISLLSPEYLLSDKRWPFHTETTGSLTPAFAPARLVSLAVKLPCAFALYGRFPIGLREPSHASVTLWEATAPVKLPTRQGPRRGFTRPG